MSKMIVSGGGAKMSSSNESSSFSGGPAQTKWNLKYFQKLYVIKLTHEWKNREKCQKNQLIISKPYWQ